MKFLVNAEVFRNALMCQSKDDIRYYLNGIHFVGNRAEATNGHYAYIGVSVFDDIPGHKDLKGIPTRANSTIIHFEGKFPTKKRGKAPCIVKVSIDGGNALATVYGFYGEILAVLHGNVIEGRFPNVTRAFAAYRKEEKTMAVVRFQPKYLSMIEKMQEGRSFPNVDIEMFGENAVAIFTWREGCKPEGCKHKFAIMPLRK